MKRVLGVLLFVLCSSLYVSAQVEIVKSTEKIVVDGQKYYLHTVESGQTLYSICKAYDMKEKDVKKSNPDLTDNLKLEQVIRIPIYEEATEDGYILYTVKPSDTMYSLCRKYGVTEEEVVALNRKVKKNKPIKVGQEIKFPAKVIEDQIPVADKDTANFHYHLIEKGETLYSLCKIYNVEKEEVIAVNENFDGTNLVVGQLLKIPRKVGGPIVGNQIINDSITDIDIVNDSIVLDSINVCDTAKWFTHGKDFTIAILLPFEIDANMRSLYNQETSNQDQKIYSLTEKVVAFYSGCLVAFENFESEDIKLNVKVFDIGKKNTSLEKIISEGELDNCDLIIGPAYKSQVNYLNENLRDTLVSIVLPFVNDDEVLKNYRQNVFLKPSLELVRENVAKYAALNPDNNYLIIQGPNEGHISNAILFKESLINELGSEENVKTIKFNGKDLTSLKSMVDKTRENVFILPFSNEAATMQIFTELFPLKDYDLTLIGASNILSYESIDPLYYEKVKFTYYSNLNINYSDTLTYRMLSKYRDVFLCEPGDYSFMAYDAITYFVSRLAKYGTNFTQCICVDEVYNGISGDIKYITKPEYAEQSYSNRTVYMHSMQEDFTFEMIYPLHVLDSIDQDTEIEELPE